MSELKNVRPAIVAPRGDADATRLCRIVEELQCGSLTQIEPEAAKAAELFELADIILLSASIDIATGVALLQRNRIAQRRAPVLVFGSARDDAGIAAMLDAGADGWLHLDAPTRVVVSALRAFFRSPYTALFLHASDVTMDVLKRSVTRGARRLWLTPKEFDVLQIFLRSANRTVPGGYIAEMVWGRESPESNDSFRHVLRSLRRKLNEPTKPKLLHTVWGEGYRLEEEQ